jgi:hypothetical protein
MSSNSSLTPLMGMLLAQLPMMLVYLAGIVFALVRLQRNPRPAALVLIGCVILFVALLLGPLVQTWVINNRTSVGVRQIGQILTIFNLVMSFVRAAAFVLLIIAAFVGRPEADPMYSAFPVGSAPGFEPPPLPRR